MQQGNGAMSLLARWVLLPACQMGATQQRSDRNPFATNPVASHDESQGSMGGAGRYLSQAPLLQPGTWPHLACLPACPGQVGEQMKRVPGGNGQNPFAQMVEDAEGLDKIEALQVRSSSR